MPLTINVTFPNTIDAALTQLKGKVLAAPVTIQIAPDSRAYTMNTIDLGGVNAASLTITGDVNDATKVTIICTSLSANGNSMVTVQGLTLQAPSGGATYGIVSQISTLSLNNVRVINYAVCISAEYATKVYTTSFYCQGANHGLEIGGRSTVFLPNANLIGQGTGAGGTGIFVGAGSFVMIGGASITSFTTALDCSGGGMVENGGSGGYPASTTITPNTNCGGSTVGTIVLN